MNTLACESCQRIFYSFSSEEIKKCGNCSSKQNDHGQENISDGKIDFDSYVGILKKRRRGCNSGSGCCG